MASTTEVVADSVSYTGAFLTSSKHDTTAGSTKIWGEYAIPDENSETPQIEATDKFNYADNSWTDSITDPGYSGAGTKDETLSLGFNGSMAGANSAYSYFISLKTANAQCDGLAGSAVFDVYRDTVDIDDVYCGEAYTDSTTNAQFTINQGGTAYVVGDTYTFTAFKASGDTDVQKSLEIKQAGDTVTVGSGETMEIKGGGLSDGSDFTTVTFTPATGSWDLNNNTGSEITFQEATINYLKVNAGTVTVLNTTLNNEVAPTAGAVLNADWYLGAHVVSEDVPATDINTAVDDVTISENSGTPVATVYKWSGSAWTGPATTQTSETDSNGLLIQPGTDDAIRIREYKRENAGYTHYYYNMYIDNTESYSAYDYKDDQGGYYLTSTLNTSSGHDEIISESWLRNNIDINNTDGTRNDPPANGTWYVGMLGGLEVTITGTAITFDDLNFGNSFTDTASTQTQITVSTSATNGYIVTAWETQKMTHNDFGAVTIDNFNVDSGADYGDYADPLTWTNNCSTATPNNECGFGFTSNDTLVEGVNRYNNGTEYAGFSESSASPIRVIDYSSPADAVSNLITYRISASNTQRPGTYSTTIVYVVTAEY